MRAHDAYGPLLHYDVDTAVVVTLKEVTTRQAKVKQLKLYPRVV